MNQMRRRRPDPGADREGGFIAALGAGAMAFSQGDIDGWIDLWADDAVWHGAGTTAYGGRFEGTDAIRGWFETLYDLGLRARVLDVTGDDENVVFVVNITGEVAGVSVDQRHTNAYRIEDGRIAEGWFFPDDPDAWDAVLRAADA